MSVAAALVELFASRAGSAPPAWTKKVGPSSELLILDPGLGEMPRFFAHARRYGPEPFQRRNLVVLPDFLEVV
jgi:hypothetical protein